MKEKKYYLHLSAPIDIVNKSTLDLYDTSVVTYIAGFCTRKIIKNLNCDKCKNVLCKEGEENSWIKKKQYENCHLITPSIEVLNIVKNTEMILKPSLLIKNVLKKGFFNSIVIKCVNDFLQCSTTLNSLKNHPDDHRYPIVKAIVKKYIFIRICKFLKNRNMQLKQKSLRKKLTSTVHFANQ